MARGNMYSPQTIHQKVKKIIKNANRIFKKAFKEGSLVKEKPGVQLSISVITQADEEIDSFLRRKLKQAFPETGFITEEVKEQRSSSPYNWIIDPIDGTANFAHRIPICGISIALWKKDTPIYAILSFPLLQETIHALKDGGVFLNQSVFIPPRKQITKKPYFVYSHVGSPEEKQKIYQIVPFPSNFMSAAYQIALVALGRADCSISVGLPIWDIAAGLLIAQEAGRHIEYVSQPPSLSRSDFRDYNNTFVISEKKLAQEISGKIRRVLEVKN